VNENSNNVTFIVNDLEKLKLTKPDLREDAEVTC